MEITDEILRRMPWMTVENRDPAQLLEREWLVTNGLGGYASGSVSGACTRRYHGLLIAAMPTPLGRMVMLNHVAEEIRVPGGDLFCLYGEERADEGLALHGESLLDEFRLEAGLPVWIYKFSSYILEKRVMQPHLQNSTYVSYRIVEGDGSIRLGIRPSLNYRAHEAAVSTPLAAPYHTTVQGGRVEVTDGRGNTLRMMMFGRNTAIVVDRGRNVQLQYRLEYQRGYDFQGSLWSPGYFRCDLKRGEAATIVASMESWDILELLEPTKVYAAEAIRRSRLVTAAVPAAQVGMAAELVLAADQFVITPASRKVDEARARATGEDVRTVIAGYHWFTDWGRDTMISLEGLTLCTGRHQEAAWILRTFARYVRDGLLPNLFPEGERDGLYHTADATLWYFHAIDRYVTVTQDFETLDQIVPVLQDIVDHHVRGTRFGIGVDPEDGLLRQGAAGYQLTWMDAKVDDWVVTPRRGKAVEINALWYNALRLLQSWTLERGHNQVRAAELDKYACQAQTSFNDRFWYEAGGYLYDVIDEQQLDTRLRPNQVLAISLRHPVLDQTRWVQVVRIVADRLGTPMGLRTLAPGEQDYKPRYDGDLRARDAAYHQGTVWAWLIGPFVDAWIKTFPSDLATPRQLLEGFEYHLREACLGSISEIFDAEAPYQARGCIAQAWSVAEVLRCWVKTQKASGANQDGSGAGDQFVKTAPR
jgi:predicted glycogen debranching enzyme